jgi:hypothetical protein
MNRMLISNRNMHIAVFYIVRTLDVDLVEVRTGQAFLIDERGGKNTWQHICTKMLN